MKNSITEKKSGL